ncbi:hypothetical protein DYP12_22515 [Escherichia coli]|nr:hypothetical protein [Escherichia coli]EFO0859566.1 hypothetical protein [Escherichia coli]
MQILELCNSPEFASLPPNVIVPTLADRGTYIASESTFYRVLKSANQLTKRSRECQYKRPDVLRAVAPNQVWSWDISYLPSWVRGQHFYLYMIVDIYSRSKRLTRTVLIFTESSDQLSRATDRVPGLPASPGYVQ